MEHNDEERRRQALAELRGSSSWEWLTGELTAWMDAEFDSLMDGAEDIRDYEFRRGRIRALEEVVKLTDV